MKYLAMKFINMRIVIFVLLSLFSISAFAQTPKERIKALKTAHITKELSLTNEEAKVFWPIYDAYDLELEEGRRTQARKMMEKSRDVDTMNEDEAKQFIADYLELEQLLYKAQEKLIKNLQDVLSTQKIAKLLIAERTFNQRMLQRFRGRG